MTSSQPRGFLALPSTGQGPAILVLHAWWGLNETIKTFCMRLADAGFVAFALDLYHGQVTDTIAGAEALGGALDANQMQVQAEIAAATAFLSQLGDQLSSGVAVIGFSLGAYYALALAAAAPAQIGSVVLFYGTGGGDFSAAKADFLGHFAANDPYEPVANVEELAATLKQTGRQVTFYQYPDTGHWFFEPDRTDAYNADAAALAWERTLAFLKRPAN